ncbi:hypothetical protein HmCmsJML184_04657 [Escherichia coli]|nr:hypothetical protein HmCmsJML184_04657 [Escherichia coli]
MHKSENEKIDFILDEHERIFRNVNPGFLLKASISYLCCGFRNGTA